MSNAYLFPEVYVENSPSHRHLCIDERDETTIIDGNNVASCRRIYGLIPYERVIDHIDLEQAKTTSSIAVLRFNSEKNIYEGYLLEKNASLCLQEITGNYIIVTLREGEIINENTRLAYVVTNKLEVRNIKSRCSGLIAFLIDKPWEEPRKMLLVTTNEYRTIIARKNT